MSVIRSGYRPGAIGRVAELHATYYGEQWGFGLFFEAKVATELAAFLSRFDDTRDGFWVAEEGNRIVGSITIDGAGDGGGASAQGARLRWFILEPAHHGRGIGKALMRGAMAHCERAGFGRVYLWTFAGLDAARHLYEAAGFRLVTEHADDQWGRVMTEQLFERML